MIAIEAEDAPGEAPVAARQAALAAHLAHIEAVMDRLLVAGPLVDASGRVTGSLLIVDTDDEAEARALMDADPYSHAGIWVRVTYRRFRGVAGAWVGGKHW